MLTLLPHAVVLRRMPPGHTVGWAFPLLVLLLVSKHPSKLKMSWKRFVKEVFGYLKDYLILFPDMGREVYYKAFH